MKDSDVRRYQPIPKPPPRIRDPQAGTGKLIAEGRCRLCGKPIRDVRLSRHHLIARGQGGDDVDDNLVPLCGSGTEGCHGDVEHWRAMARQRLRRLLRPEEVRYVNRRGVELGKPGLLDTLYPWG